MTTKKKPLLQLDQRIPPHSVEAEQGVIGSMLVDAKNTIPFVLEKIMLEDFYVPAHQILFTAINEMYENGKTIDLITFTQHLRDNDKLDEIGGDAFVAHLITFVPTSANVKYYVEIVKDKRTLRDIIQVATEGVRQAHEEQQDAKGLLATTQVKLAEIVPFNLVKRKTVPDYLAEKMEAMENGEPDQDILITRFTELDRLCPIKKGDMPCIFSTRKMGKSTLALSIMENVCIATKGTGIYFSLEDRTSKVVDRLLAGVSRIPINKHHVKHLSQAEIETCLAAVKKICLANFIVHDDIYEIHAIVARAKKDILDNPNTVLIAVDYCQLVKVYGKKNASREQDVASISRNLRMLALETGIPVIVVSQENSDGATRESKSIEADSTHGLRVTNIEDEVEEKIEQNKKRIQIPFQRNGESNIFFDLQFNGAIARFENLAQLEIIKNGAKK